jgi:hypothetical protein
MQLVSRNDHLAHLAGRGGDIKSVVLTGHTNPQFCYTARRC